MSAPLNAKKTLGPKQYPYMFDVVEVFVTVSETGFPYYEFEVSPYNQTFQVRIVKGKPFQDGVDLGLVSSAKIVPGGWTAEMKIPLKPLGWDGDPGENPGQSLFCSGTSSRAATGVPSCRKPKSRIFISRNFFKPLLQCA